MSRYIWSKEDTDEAQSYSLCASKALDPTGPDNVLWPVSIVDEKTRLNFFFTLVLVLQYGGSQ